ncbi:MAG: zinc-dependent metalloprotease [Chitinophagaceae bacterium]
MSKAKQKEAVDFLNKELFTTPAWLINNLVFDRTGGNPISIMVISRIIC